MSQTDELIETIGTETPESISYFAFEGEMTRMERTNHRLWILCVILIVCLVGTNAAWVWYESQFEEVVLTQEAQTENGKISLNGVGSGEIYYYEATPEPEK